MKKNRFFWLKVILLFVVALGVYIINYSDSQKAGKSNAAGAIYYVSQSGSSSNPGTSSDAPTVFSRVSNGGIPLNPGDKVLFKKGDTFSGHLQITYSGVDGNPIIYGSYGESGAAPILENSGGQWSHPITLLASYVVVQDLHLQNAGDAGICIDSCSSGRSGTASHNLIQNLEINNTGTGLRVYGHDNRITNNKIHDLKMIVNTSGGDDDWGATGIFLYNGNNDLNKLDKLKTATDIAQELKKHRSAVSRVLLDMEKASFVRCVNPEDDKFRHYLKK